ncbi:hypothetical protein L798_11359 [Zootermopsis nevadensis]|uniref:Uncharacterized protein n=1 Tax=Zootermopsis nevadensis TaxID=136037 RepID=A0A067RV77_ZOONE|nr:hypothetical protein L798_11359 [Zootermopsis nevadensis]
MGQIIYSNCPCCDNEPSQVAAVKEGSVTKLLAVFKELDRVYASAKGYSVDDIAGYMRKNLHTTGDVESQVTTALNIALSKRLIGRRYRRYIFVGPIASKMKYNAPKPRVRFRRPVSGKNKRNRRLDISERSPAHERRGASKTDIMDREDECVCRCHNPDGNGVDNTESLSVQQQSSSSKLLYNFIRCEHTHTHTVSRENKIINEK